MSTDRHGIADRNRWECSYERVWSLWDMLEKYGQIFAQAALALNETKWLCAPWLLEESKVGFSREVIDHGALEALNRLRRACILSDMDAPLPEIDRVQDMIRPHNPHMPPATDNAVGQAFKHLLARIEDDLEHEFFFHVTATDVQFYQAQMPFGEGVAKRFENANEDIAEAAKCIALQRPTACVFHLMRVMERGVQAFGKKVKITINPLSEPWGQIMMHVDNGIKGMAAKTSRQKAKRARYAAVAAHLDHVRLAWRNEVMHPKQTYTRQEAFDLFNAVRVFMMDLAETI